MSTPKKKYNPLSEQGDMKMLISTDFAEGLKDVCPESIWFSAVSKPDADFVTGFVKQQTDEVPENFCGVYDWISKSANIEDFFGKFICPHAKRKISKTELLIRGQNDNKFWYNYRKGVITASKAHSVLTKMNKILKSGSGCIDMWSLCQNILGLYFTNLD